jgi:hypothetical protein
MLKEEPAANASGGEDTVMDTVSEVAQGMGVTDLES